MLKTKLGLPLRAPTGGDAHFRRFSFLLLSAIIVCEIFNGDFHRTVEY